MGMANGEKAMKCIVWDYESAPQEYKELARECDYIMLLDESPLFGGAEGRYLARQFGGFVREFVTGDNKWLFCITE